MSIKYGFFDATYDSSTETYDRAYSSGHFTEYFGQVLGSGVCVYKNEDSMLVSVSGTDVTVAAGYLFINGYWLKNDGDYIISMSAASAGTYAIVARLDLSSRTISITYEETSTTYYNALVLAYVTVSANGALTATDTRSDALICGLIDTAGSLSKKVTDALDTIENDIPAAFSAYESQLTEWQNNAASDLSDAQSEIDSQISSLTNTIQSEVSALNSTISAEISSVDSTVDSKLDDVNAALERLPTPRVGEIKFSAAGAETGWLLCDGSYISENDYPDLVEALGKLSPGTDDLIVRKNSGAGRQISNGYIYGNYLWVYSYSSQMIHGIYLSDMSIKSVIIIDQDQKLSTLVSPSIKPICLTIINGTLFLSQIRGNGTASDTTITLLKAAFNTGSENINLYNAFESYGNARVYGSNDNALPYITKETVDGVEKFSMCTGLEGTFLYYWTWLSGDGSPTSNSVAARAPSDKCIANYSFNKKNSGELVYVYSISTYSSSVNTYYFRSLSNGLYNSSSSVSVSTTDMLVENVNITPIVGGPHVLWNMARDADDPSKLSIKYLDKSMNTKMTTLTTENLLPGSSKIFSDAAVYCADKYMWFFFVGTGLVFTHDITNRSAYGFLNTTDVLGALSYFGYMDYDEDNSILVIIGQDNSGVVKVAKLDLSNWTYSDTGAYLPMLSSGGIPAYIKAVSSS